MTPLNAVTLESLQVAFKEVAFRANRLREWADMEPRLLNLESRFGEFYEEAKDSTDNMDDKKKRKMNDLWGRLEETELLDLQTFVEGLREINRSSWAEGNGNGANASTISVLPKADISTIIQFMQPIKEALADKAWVDLVEQCNLFKRAMKGHLLNHRNIVRRELRELCELTIRLSVALGMSI